MAEIPKAAIAPEVPKTDTKLALYPNRDVEACVEPESANSYLQKSTSWEQDPENPMNWGPAAKAFHTAVAASVAFLV